MKLKIALLQLLPGSTLSDQLEKGIYACRKAKEIGADIALFPEMWSDGYRLPQDAHTLDDLSVSEDSPFIREFQRLAGELRMAIVVTFLESHDPKPLNSVILFDRNGEKVLHYSKVHTCDFDEEKVLSSGREFHVADLDTGEGTVRVGSMICFDREFPESARVLMLKGAEVILAPNACPMEINRLSALRTRAYENMLAVATCNYPEGQPDCNGRSTVFDGVPWMRDEPGMRDMCIFEAPAEEGIYLAEIDMDLLRRYRKNDVNGDKYRHPEAYGLLSAGFSRYDIDTDPVVSLESFYGKPKKLVEKCLILFSRTIHDHLLSKYDCSVIGEIPACNGHTSIYSFSYAGERIAFYLSGIGSALSSGTCYEVHWQTGAAKFIMFGSCGSLDREKTSGKYIIPTECYRGDGCSFYYAPPSDYLKVKNADRLSAIFNEIGIPYVKGRVWTTDSMLRETAGLVQKRRNEGCLAVEMELAGVEAVCDFYGLELYDFLESGDVLEENNYDIKGLTGANHNLGKLMIALEVAKRI